jgi:hypothetical protein
MKCPDLGWHIFPGRVALGFLSFAAIKYLVDRLGIEMGANVD